MKKILLCLSALVTIVLAGCGNNAITPQSKTVKIGVIVPLSGPASGYGTDAVNVYKDRLAHFQKDNPNQKVELIVEDGKCNGAAATSAAQKLISVDNVDMILGGLCSAETIAAGKVAQENGITLLAPASSAPSISTMGDRIFRFRNDAWSAIGLNNYISQHYNHIAIIGENTDYARAVNDKFKALFTGTIALESQFNSEEKDFSIISNKIKNQQNNIDALLLVVQSESTAASLVKSFKNEGIINKYKNNIISLYVFSSKTFLDMAGPELSEGLVQVNVDMTKQGGTGGKEYMEYFKRQYGITSTPQFILLDAEGADLVLDAIGAGNTTSDTIKKYFEGININNKRDSLIGNYYFDENGDAVGLESDIIIEKITKGKEVILD